MAGTINIPTISNPRSRQGQNLPTMGRIVENKTEEWFTFKPEDKIISGDDPEMKYQRHYGQGQKGVAWGQRKLAMSIIQFLTEFWNPSEVPEPILIYIGAAPGTNIEFVMKNFFPQFEVHLYDPRPMKVTPSDNLIVHQQLFTSEDARDWAGRNDVFLMSDIRTSSDEKPSEQDVWNDMLLQQDIYERVRPVKAQLKFRLPYYIEGPDSLFGRYVEYLYGLVYIGIYASYTSTETRLVPMENPDGIRKISWDILKYESQLYYHNNVTRGLRKFRNPIVSEDDPQSLFPIDGSELVNDYDSVAEAVVWGNYLRKIGGIDLVVPENVVGVSRALTIALAGDRPKDKMVTLALIRSDPLFIKRKFFV